MRDAKDILTNGVGMSDEKISELKDEMQELKERLLEIEHRLITNAVEKKTIECGYGIGSIISYKDGNGNRAMMISDVEEYRWHNNYRPYWMGVWQKKDGTFGSQKHRLYELFSKNIKVIDV